MWDLSLGRGVWLVCLILPVPVPLHVHVIVIVTQRYMGRGIIATFLVCAPM